MVAARGDRPEPPELRGEQPNDGILPSDSDLASGLLGTIGTYSSGTQSL